MILYHILVVFLAFSGASNQKMYIFTKASIHIMHEASEMILSYATINEEFKTNLTMIFEMKKFFRFATYIYARWLYRTAHDVASVWRIVGLLFGTNESSYTIASTRTFKTGNSFFEKTCKYCQVHEFGWTNRIDTSSMHLYLRRTLSFASFLLLFLFLLLLFGYLLFLHFNFLFFRFSQTIYLIIFHFYNRRRIWIRFLKDWKLTILYWKDKINWTYSILFPTSLYRSSACWLVLSQSNLH